ncbi:DUF2169 domain-containing protein [Achromobacter sp. SD115]|uniref:DUF2169 family type VI secretion system accessory protein n=1 Tax=Achromobacter sp. SD115 TaxID=2782011 RepID=UPI001A9685DB|nr:DUF2169 domain-containing protein [Achromobacter sp. SD115]MBO1014148.1 DUF2169 domain-containing protein [Achromobacter sp. SD115]
MKTLKPLHLGLLTRPYRWARRDQLGVSVIALVDISQSPRLALEQELWKLVGGEIGGMLDLATPKLYPEVLVTGHAYPQDPASPGACAVRLQMGAIDKSLLVFGDRYWRDGKATEPRPFERMRLDWRHAYGGPSEPGNPLGLGAQDEVIGGVRTRRLPNIEHPQERISAPTQRPAPAGFGPLAMEWPQRAIHMGRQYGEEWLEHDFPGFAADMDWRFFNAAQPDQWGPANASFASGTEYALWHMHPDCKALTGRLPGWRARCFISRQDDAGALEEVALRLTTVWFFPDHTQMVLIWHGATPVREDDAADILHIMPALEHDAAPRGITHYEEVLRQRLDPEMGAVYALQDAQLVPEDICGDTLNAGERDWSSRPSLRNAHAGATRRHVREREALSAQGLDPDQYLAAPEPYPAAPRLADLPQSILRAKQELEEAKRLHSGLGARALADPDLPSSSKVAGVDLDALRMLEPSPNLDPGFDPRSLRRQLAEFDTAPHVHARGAAQQANEPHPPPLSQTLGSQVQQGYLQSAHLFAAPSPMSPLRARRTRSKLQAHLKGDRNCADMNLSGADLSGLDLSNVNFQRAVLAGADLSDARLDGSDLSHAVLAGATLLRTGMRNVALAHANLGRARCAQTDFKGSQFSASTWDHAQAESCDFGESVWRLGFLRQVRFQNCDFGGAIFEQVSATQVTLQGCHFHRARLDQCAFMQGAFADTDFTQADLKRVSFLNMEFSGRFSLEHAMLDGCAFAGGAELPGACLRGMRFKQGSARGASFSGADMRGAQLISSDFSECCLKDADLSGVTAPDTHFVRTDFTGARLRDANLINSLLGKAILLDADLAGANLFRADVAQARMDGSTGLDDTYTQGVKRWPARQPENAA